MIKMSTDAAPAAPRSSCRLLAIRTHVLQPSHFMRRKTEVSVNILLVDDHPGKLPVSRTSDPVRFAIEMSRVGFSSPAPKPIIELLRRRLGFADSDPVHDADLEEHIGIVRIGNEPINRWVTAPALLRPEAFIQIIGLVTPATT